MCKTDPIRNTEDIKRFKQYFLDKKSYRNYALVTVAMNTSLRIGDLLRLTWDDVYNFKTKQYREHIAVTEQKTGKHNRIALNKEAVQALQTLRDSLGMISEEDYLFKSRVGHNHPIDRTYAFRIIKEAVSDLNLEGSIIGTGRRIQSMSFSATTADLDLMNFDWESAGEEDSDSGRIFLTYAFETDGSYTEEIDVRGEPTFTEVTFRTDVPSTVCCRQLSLPPVYDGAFTLHLNAEGPVSRDEDIRVTLSGSAACPRIIVEYMGMKNYWIGG